MTFLGLLTGSRQGMFRDRNGEPHDASYQPVQSIEEYVASHIIHESCYILEW